jgi:regulator of cell morphogenesis and NO signaling
MNNPSQATIGDEDGSPWAERSPADIVAFILQRFHEPLRQKLPELLASAREVEAENRGHGLCPAGLAAHLEQVLVAVESHLQKEEKILFPLILAGRGSVAFMPIKVMMAEHDDHLTNLEYTAKLAHGFALPEDASPAWRALYLGLAQLERDLREHIALENQVLFPCVLAGDGSAR